MPLTGYTDLDAAIRAVNEGNIFRFLTKPCEKTILAKSLTGGLVQYRLITAERDLLENTLMGSIKVLTDILSAASPEAFGRSTRIAKIVRYVADKFQLSLKWRFEAAAMLSQLGCITLDPELVLAAYAGKGLSAEDQAKFAAHPQAARDLLINIPRLEPIAWMISQQLTPSSPEVPPDGIDFSADIFVGAKLLRLAIAFDDLTAKGMSDHDAIGKLCERGSGFEAELVQSLLGMNAQAGKMQLNKITMSELAVGMILQQEIRTRCKGLLLAAKGQEITPTLLIKFGRLAQWGAIDDEVIVFSPATGPLATAASTSLA